MNSTKPTPKSVEDRLLRAEASLAALSRGEVDFLIGAREPLIVRFKSLVEEKERQSLLLDTLIETAPTLILQTDFQHRIVRFNGACERLTGYSRDEVLGKSMAEVFPTLAWTDLVAEVVAAKLAHSSQPASAPRHVSPWITKTGEKSLVEWRCAALDSPSGTGHCNLGIGLDVTERERAQEIANEARRYAESIIATVREPLLVLDGSLRVEAANQSFYRTFQVNPAETLGRRFFELGDHQWEIPALRELLESILPEGASFENFEVDYLLPGTGRRTFVLNARRVQRDARRIDRILLAIEDVTDHRVAVETVQQQARILQSILETAGDGIAVADEQGKFLFFNPAAEQILGLGKVDTGPEGWSSAYSCYKPDGVTPYPAAEIPLAMAIRGESVDQAEIILKNERFPIGRWISVTARPLGNGEGRLRGGAVVFRDITELKQLEQALRRTSDQLTHITDASAAILCTLKVEGDLLLPTWISANAVTILGYPMEEMLDPAWWPRCLHPDDRATALAGVESLRTHDRLTHEYRFLHNNGSVVWLRDEMRLTRNAAGHILQIVGASLDITDRKSLEAQLQQAQKMDAFGQLAGGVAHDFNNLITIITGYSEMLLCDGVAADQQRYFLREIKSAGERAAGLTRQLLAFSRKQILQPVDLNLNLLVADTEKMLRRLIGEDIDLATGLDPELGRVRADPGQIEQVIMNLAINARDAMPTGGHLTIDTRNITLDQYYVQKHRDAQPGNYVMLAVTDSGCGMDEATCSRVFEPFFTTKEVGKGTGLGLATVHGIVKQSNGSIEVDSEVGHGTTFKVYLPRLQETVVSRKSASGVPFMPPGHETILLAEDEDGVRGLVRLVLESIGYTVLEARNGLVAARICQEHAGPIHLLATDVVMPKMSGRELAHQVIAMRPAIKVLYLSGYTDDAVVRHGILEAKMAFLQKPLTPMTLAKKVREVLDQ